MGYWFLCRTYKATVAVKTWRGLEWCRSSFRNSVQSLTQVYTPLSFYPPERVMMNYYDRWVRRLCYFSMMKRSVYILKWSDHPPCKGVFLYFFFSFRSAQPASPHQKWQCIWVLATQTTKFRDETIEGNSDSRQCSAIVQCVDSSDIWACVLRSYCAFTYYVRAAFICLYFKAILHIWFFENAVLRYSKTRAHA